jgi:hypothetical protein
MIIIGKPRKEASNTEQEKYTHTSEEGNCQEKSSEQQYKYEFFHFYPS